jgi:hypothetical protein
MFRKDLTLIAVALLALGFSISNADEYGFRTAPRPFVDPVPNILPVEPGVDQPMYSTLPVEPIMDPVPGVKPKDPVSDQPVRSILPVEPGMDPRRMPMPYWNDGENSNRPLIGGSDDNTREIDPSVYPMPVGGPMPNLPREVSRRVRNILPKEYGSDEPGGGVFASQPVIANPIPVEPGIDPRREPMGYSFDGANSRRRLTGGTDDNLREVDPSVYPTPVGGPMPNQPRVVSRRASRNVIADGRSVYRPWPNRAPGEPVSRRALRGVLPIEKGKVMPSNPRGNYAVGQGITEPGDMPRRTAPTPVNAKDGVTDQPNYGNVIPIRLPNPLVTQTAQVRFQPAQLSSSQLQLSVYDLTGKIVVNSSLAARRDGVYRVDLGRLSNGTYLLRLSAPGVDATQKLVIQR